MRYVIDSPIDLGRFVSDFDKVCELLRCFSVCVIYVHRDIGVTRYVVRDDCGLYSISRRGCCSDDDEYILVGADLRSLEYYLGTRIFV